VPALWRSELHPRDKTGRFVELRISSSKLVRDRKELHAALQTSDDPVLQGLELGRWANKLYSPHVMTAHDEHGNVIGFAHYEAPRRGDQQVSLHDFRVAKSAQGRGVGAVMIQALRERHPELPLKVYSSVHSARPFYEHTGGKFAHDQSSTAAWEPLKPRPKKGRRVEMSNTGEQRLELAVSPGGRPADASPFGKKGGPRRLDDYEREVAHALQRNHGWSESHAIAAARNAISHWAVGQQVGGFKGHPRPQVQAAAAAATIHQHVLDHAKRGSSK
jgi:GNAT superfamily N-acetyltransferase